MTAFAGIFALEPGGLSAASAISETLAATLSRRSDETIHTSRTDGAIAHWFDIDAWGDGPAVHDDGGRFLCVCGDPAFGEATTRQAGIDEFIAAFTADPEVALAAAPGTFALLGMDADKVILAADKFGSRPVYWSRQGGALCFATNFRTLRDALAGHLSIDQQALRETVFAGQPLGDRTLFREIRLLRPGHMLRASGGEIRLAPYHSWADVAPSTLDREGALAAVHAAFMKAIRRRSYTPTADAFLSGGMDSRAVVAGLLDAGVTVNTFNSSYPGSADHVLGDEIAAHLGTNHRTDLRDPVESRRYTLETFANFARRAAGAFPRGDGRPEGAGRTLWSGDGGSVLMGHVYMTVEKMTEFTAAPIDADVVRRRFPGNGLRSIRDSRTQAFRDAAHAGIAAEIDAIACPRPDRRVYLFYALNNQARHLYWNHEQIDRSRVELVTPFFDADLIETVVSLPTEWFLLHDFYNDWIRCFEVAANAVPWQVYPGHVPGPHPPRDDLRQQWRDDWQGRRAALGIDRSLVGRVLRDSGRFSRQVLDFPFLRLCQAGLLLGSNRFGHEIRAANKLSAELDRPY